MGKNNIELLDINRRRDKLPTSVSRKISRMSNVVHNKSNHSQNKDSKKYKHFFDEEISGYELLTYHLEVNENLQRMMAISICLNNNRKYDTQNIYQEYYYCPLP